MQTAAGCAIRMENTCHAGSVEILGAAKSLPPRVPRGPWSGPGNRYAFREDHWVEYSACAVIAAV